MATASPPPNPDAPPDPKAYYGYLFQPDKAPTILFDTFLRAMTQHIIENIGDKEDKNLSPAKLGAFYKAVGHDYDSLFVDSPHQSISFIWQITGCQHSLQPTLDDFAPPSVPALTPKGFVRWQSVETLLCPDIHVPLLQRVAKEWGLINPTTGKPFPSDLPKEALPSVPDAEVEKWHDQCANKLRREATMADKDNPPSPKTTSRPVFKESTYHYPRNRTGPAPTSPPPKPRNVSPHGSPETPDDVNGPTFSFNHVPPHYMPSGATTAAAAAAASFATAAAASKWKRHVRLSPPEDDRRNAARRRSFSDYPPAAGPGGAKLRTHSPPAQSASHMNMSGTYAPHRPRRHSHPHHHSSSSDSSDDGDDELPSMRPRNARRPRLPDDPPMPSVRRVYPQQIPTVVPDPFPAGPMPPGKRESSSSGADRRRREERIPIPPQGRSPHRSPHRNEDTRPRAFGVASDIRDKLSSVLPNGILGANSKPERPRSTSRSQSHQSPGMGSVPLRYSKESLQGSRLGRSWSYDSDEEDGGSVGAGGGERRPPRSKDRDGRDRDHDRDRDRDRDRPPRRDRDDDRGEYMGRRARERERDRGDHNDRNDRPYRSREKDRDRDRDRDRVDRDIRDREREREMDRRERERDRARERDPDYVHDRGSRDALREKKKAKSLDRSRDREPRDRDIDRDDDRDRDYRGSRRDRDRDRGDRDRERDRHPLRSEPLKRPISSADLDRER